MTQILVELCWRLARLLPAVPGIAAAPRSDVAPLKISATPWSTYLGLNAVGPDVAKHLLSKSKLIHTAR